jgi:cytochrome c peroxidase
MLDPAKATAGELAGEKLFFGKAQCSSCHPAPVYLDNQMHDLHVERFLKNEAGDGPIKAFTLRGIKDGPPYLHDGRLLTLEDTVEFFNFVLELKLTPDEKHNLVEFMRQLQLAFATVDAPLSVTDWAIASSHGLRLSEDALARCPLWRSQGQVRPIAA